MRRTASDPVKAFFVALFLCLKALCVLPIRSASCFHRRFVVPFVQKKLNKSSTSCWSPHPLKWSFTTCSQWWDIFQKRFVTRQFQVVMQIFCSDKRAPLAQPPPPALAVVQPRFNCGSAVQSRTFRVQPGKPGRTTV